MAELRLEPQYVIVLTNSELTLILKALGGRLGNTGREEESLEAKDLGDKLTEAKVAQAKNYHDNMAKLESNLRKREP